MSLYYLGIDVGGTKTHALVATEEGQAVGFGEAGPGNHETVGYGGLEKALCGAFEQAMASAALSPDQIVGAGFGIAGYDWPSEERPTLNALAKLGLKCPLAAYNDTILGLVAGSVEGWGLAVVSGTGCNCWGWDRTRSHIGHVTGGGIFMGEGAGSSELMFRAIQAIAHEWTRRGPATALTTAFIHQVGARDLPDLLEGLINGRYRLGASEAPLVFQAAAAGDAVATELIRWAGSELGELANAVIRQLNFEALAFDVVLVGSMYTGSALLIDTMRQKILTLAPEARLTRLTVPPVLGAVLLGMETAGYYPSTAARQALSASTLVTRNGKNPIP
jgi:N-acetylglucosamine kinase-like BadF-type ATPase